MGTSIKKPQHFIINAFPYPRNANSTKRLIVPCEQSVSHAYPLYNVYTHEDYLAMLKRNVSKNKIITKFYAKT